MTPDQLDEALRLAREWLGYIEREPRMRPHGMPRFQQEIVLRVLLALHSECAALRAEVERLTGLTRQVHDSYKTAKAELERIRPVFDAACEWRELVPADRHWADIRLVVDRLTAAIDRARSQGDGEGG